MTLMALPKSSGVQHLRAEHERDLYRRLLTLGERTEFAPFLEEALGLVVDVTGAEQAVIEIYGKESNTEDGGRWLARGCTDAEASEIRAAISRGIVARTLATGQTVKTASALLDPRFRDRASVHRGRIEAVLCAPIGVEAPLGVLYLQGVGPFRDEDRELVEILARHLAPFVDRLLVRQIHSIDVDHTRAIRENIRCESIVGKVAAAEGGTLFLDEIGELPVQSQAKLLQLLQSKLYFPLGAHRPEKADVRVITASNCNLQEAVRTKRFREDLFFRLQVLPIRLPGLAERVGDIPPLALHCSREAVRRHGLPQLELSPGALRAIESAEWPGNVRQLAHSLEAAVIRAAGEGVSQVERRHVFPESDHREEESSAPVTFQDATRRFQRDLVARTLDGCSWNIAAAARQLDVARSHVYNLIKAFGLERHPC